MLRTGHGLISYPLTNLELIDDPVIDKRPVLETEQDSKPVQSMVPSSIDLHIEVLNPNYLNALPDRIRDIQTSAARRYIQSAINQKLKIITIIHGKGTGILKQEVLNVLGEFEEVQFAIPSNDGGAVEVWFKD